ncbi:MAG: hypothetical protein Q4E63_05795 [Prevotellaceae bacterium]|nr:hypothetical protein [Prevotellaceae bacterium]MDO4932145.1 hypothetical protein [Prevotellaceae bacterium]
MKKIMSMLAMLTMTLAANAQFESGTKYVGASLTGINLSYNGAKETSIGIQAKGGYFVDDCWQINAMVGYDKPGKGIKGVFQAGVGGRYYILQNGLYAGVNAKAVLSSGYNDIMPGIELGYAFFLNDKVTIEPAVYYDQSLKSHSDYSTVGLKVGVGLYF